MALIRLAQLLTIEVEIMMIFSLFLVTTWPTRWLRLGYQLKSDNLCRICSCFEPCFSPLLISTSFRGLNQLGSMLSSHGSAQYIVMYRSDLIWTIGCPYQLIHLKVTFLHYPSNLAILTSSHRNIQPDISRQGSINVNIQWTVLHSLYHHRVSHLLQLIRSHSPMHFYSIDPRQVGLGVLQQVFQADIVCHQKKALRVEIKPANSGQMPVLRKCLWEQLVNSFSFLWISMGTDISSRFVDHPQFCDWFLHLNPDRRESLQVSLIGHDHIFEDPLAIYPNQTQFDKFLSFLPRTYRLHAHPLREPNHFVWRTELRYFTKESNILAQKYHQLQL